MSEIVGSAQARAALRQLLDKIESRLIGAGPSGGSGHAEAVTQSRQELQAFVDRTRAADLSDTAEVTAVRAIDQVARDMLLDLTLGEMEGQLAKIREGSRKLEELAGQLGDEADRNLAAADAIGLKPVKEAVDAMTGLIESVKRVKSGLKADKPDEVAIATEIEKLVDQFETLRAAISRAGS